MVVLGPTKGYTELNIVNSRNPAGPEMNVKNNTRNITTWGIGAGDLAKEMRGEAGAGACTQCFLALGTSPSTTHPFETEHRFYS